MPPKPDAADKLAEMIAHTFLRHLTDHHGFNDDRKKHPQRYKEAYAPLASAIRAVMEPLQQRVEELKKQVRYLDDRKTGEAIGRNKESEVKDD